MKNLLSAFSLSFCLSACSVHSNVESNTQYVDPFVGAVEFGHCIPNACFPFGLIGEIYILQFGGVPAGFYAGTQLSGQFALCVNSR